MSEKDLDIAIEKCERIMEMDTRTMQNPVAENGWIFEKVYDLLKYLRQFQFDTDAKGDMNDLISRQAAIDAINHICPVDTEYDCTLLDRVDVRCVLSDLPSAQPDLSPCDVCRYYPPSSMDGKPCTMCPAERKNDE